MKIKKNKKAGEQSPATKKGAKMKLADLYENLMDNIYSCNSFLAKESSVKEKIETDDTGDPNSINFSVCNGTFTIMTMDRGEPQEFNGETLEEAFFNAISYYNPHSYEENYWEEVREEEEYQEEVYRSWANRG